MTAKTTVKTQVKTETKVETKIRHQESFKQKVEIQLLGQKMLLKVTEHPQHIERLVNYIRQKIDALTLGGSPSVNLSTAKLAILAALNIAEDYFRVLEENKQLKKQPQRKLVPVKNGQLTVNEPVSARTVSSGSTRLPLIDEHTDFGA